MFFAYLKGTKQSLYLKNDLIYAEIFTYFLTPFYVVIYVTLVEKKLWKKKNDRSFTLSEFVQL